MIEINLLPHREARRVADLRQTAGIFVLGLILVAGGISMTNSGMNDDIAVLETSARQLEADIERFRPQQEQVAAFKQKQRELEDKLGVIKGLDAARSGPVRMLDELTGRTPERLWLTSMSTEGNTISLEGQSLDTGEVADFLRNLNASPYFVNVDLDQTGSGKVIGGIRLVSFQITAQLANPTQEEAAAAGA